jgi:hypothetical protein
MAPSPRRLADRRRIRIATIFMASGAIVGTGMFEGLAATATHTRATTDTTTTSNSSDDSTESDFAPSSAPTQSYSPPVAQSGGS